MIFQTDLWLDVALKAAIADMRKNLYLLEDAYAHLISDPLLSQAYGKKEVDRIKAFIQKDINIFVEHRIPDIAKFPAVVIKVGGGNEDSPKDALGDSYQKDFVDPATLGGAFPATNNIVGPVTPSAYDSNLGQITFGSNVNLTSLNIYETQFVYDSVNDAYYPILVVLDDSNLLIEQGAKPNLTNMYIKRAKESYSNNRRSIWHWETNELEIQATDANDVMYLFSILMYIFIRYKQQFFDARNFAAYTISYSPLVRVSEIDDITNVYGRIITIRGRIENSAIESTSPLVDGISSGVLIDNMTSPPGVLPLVKNNIWEGQGDVVITGGTIVNSDGSGS